MEFLASQGEVHEDEVRQYITNGITDDPSIKLTLLGANSRQHFLDLVEAHDKLCRSGDSQNRSSHGFKNRPGTKKCFRCNKYGHIAKECSENDESEKQDQQNQEMFCFRCKKKGHLANNCPKPASKDPKVNHI